MTAPKRQRGGARTGAGRPPTDPATHYSEAVLVRFTPAERAAIEVARGETLVGVWVREAATARAKRAR